MCRKRLHLSPKEPERPEVESTKNDTSDAVESGASITAHGTSLRSSQTLTGSSVIRSQDKHGGESRALKPEASKSRASELSENDTSKSLESKEPFDTIQFIKLSVSSDAYTESLVEGPSKAIPVTNSREAAARSKGGEEAFVDKDTISIQQESENNPANTTEVLIPKVSEEEAASETKQTRKSKDKGKSNEFRLVHSHQIPKSILDRFARCVPAPAAGNLKVFNINYTGNLLEPEQGKVYAPKQMSRDMFCRKCEDILSSKGKTQFLPFFFDKIYDPSEPLKPRHEQYIEYGSWLYHFCVGLIFRNLLWFENMFLNEDEIYKLLVQCRKCVLNPDSLDRLPASDCPEVFILMTHLSVQEEELKHGLMNRTLSGTLEWYFGRFKLANNSLEAVDALQVSFFLFHIGSFQYLSEVFPIQ